VSDLLIHVVHAVLVLRVGNVGRVLLQMCFLSVVLASVVEVVMEL